MKLRLLLRLLLLTGALACRAMSVETATLSPAPSSFPGEVIQPGKLPQPPTAAPTSLPPPPGFRLTAYFASWSIYARGYPAAAIPAGKLTHVNYAFAIIDDHGECASGDPRADEVNFPELQQLKETHPHLRTLISVGGQGTAEAFSRVAADQAARQRFAASCVRFLQENGFDGIDIDWEYPDPAESASFTALLAELRLQLQAAAPGGAPLLLTAATGASPYQYDDISLADTAPLVDWFNLMTYDFHGPWSGLTGFNSPLYPSSKDTAESAVERETFNAHAAVLAYLERGVPAGKISLGIPFYGRGWGGVPDVNAGLYQPFVPAPDRTRSYDYREIGADFLPEGSGYTRYWDQEARVPWLYSPQAGIMISYEDPQSLSEKAAYARAHSLGGITVWHLAADGPDGLLLEAVYTGLQ